MKQDLFAWPEVEGDRNIHGPLSFVIPSAVAGYALLHERHGRLPLREVLAPAIALARRGLPADWYTTLKVANSAAVLRLYPESARIYLPNGLPPVPPYQGTPGFFALGNLAGDPGAAGRGRVARLLRGRARRLRSRGTCARWAASSPPPTSRAAAPACCRRWRCPGRPAVAGARLLLANGLTAAPTLRRVLEGMAGAASGAPPPPPTGMRASPARCGTPMPSGWRASATPSRSAAESCTTHLTACDRDGMMVAMTTTLLSSMGSRVVLPRSGVLMNNGVMWFDPAPGTPNGMAPGKRPLTNMCPVIAAGADGRRPEIAAGASGGRRILAAVAQMLPSWASSAWTRRKRRTIRAWTSPGRTR